VQCDISVCVEDKITYSYIYLCRGCDHWCQQCETSSCVEDKSIYLDIGVSNVRDILSSLFR